MAFTKVSAYGWRRGDTVRPVCSYGTIPRPRTHLRPAHPPSTQCHCQLPNSIRANHIAGWNHVYNPRLFQVTQRASATMAGVHLIPAVVGNTIGSLLAGLFIRVKSQYMTPLVASGLMAAITHIVLLFRWNGAPTGFWESQYVIPSGIGTGAASGAAL